MRRLLDNQIEVVAADNNLCGEGPIWDARADRLLWTDLSSQLLYQLSASAVKTVIPLNWMVSGIALDQSGGLVMAGPRGLHLWNGENDWRALCTRHHGETLSFNDLVADPHGRVYAGTLYLASNGIDVEKQGKLYLIEPDGQARIVDEGFEISNGLSFSPDDRILYHADTARRCIYAYTVQPESGDLFDKREFVRIPGEEGVPDGITVDEEGYVWCAHWFGAKVVRYDPDGKIARTIELPVTQVSSIAFGGVSRDDLFITTASESWNSPLAPESFRTSRKHCGGSLYRIRLEIHGKPEHYTAFGNWSV
jgi:sugar lactone lactonase YvrE